MGVVLFKKLLEALYHLPSLEKQIAICFSKDGRWYSASSSFLNNTTPISSLYICERNAEACLGDDGNLKEMCVNADDKENCMEHLYGVSLQHTNVPYSFLYRQHLHTFL